MTTQSTGVAVRENTPIAKLEANLANGADKFKMALPSHISPEKFQRTIMTAAQTNPSLLNADRQSLLVAAMKAAQDGLLPDGREAALVPFSTSQKDGAGKWIKVSQVQYMPMAYGVRKKILQSGEISNLQTGVVYRREFEAGAFLYEIGLANPIRHRPMLDLTEEDVADENIVAAYSIANLKDGTVSVEVMRRVEIDKVRQQSQTGALGQTVKFGANAGKAIEAKGPWVDWFSEMARKTVMRRHSKTLPMSGDLIDVEERDDAIAAASAHMVLASAEPAEPLRLPERDELDRQSIAEELNDEIPTSFSPLTSKDVGRYDDELGRKVRQEDVAHDPETGEVFEVDSRGMSEVSEDVARELDAGEGRATQDMGEGFNGADEANEAEDGSEKPAWWHKVQSIRGGIASAKNKQHVKSFDDEFTRIRAGLPDDVIEELDALVAAKRNELSKVAPQ